MLSEDQEFIRRTMTHPKVWPFISDDYSGAPEDFVPPLHGSFRYLTPEHKGERVGVFFYHPHTAVLWEVHTCVLPEYWGDPATQAARAGLLWMVENTSCRKVLTHVPRTNQKARMFALRVGLKDEGVNRASFLKDGDLVDQYLMGITEQEIRACQRQR
jgi:RimJ/RimL family protein N-acetyltransferase